MKQALLEFTRTQLTHSGHSLLHIAGESGVCYPSLRRVMNQTSFRELESLERALRIVGLDIIARDDHGIYHPIYVRVAVSRMRPSAPSCPVPPCLAAEQPAGEDGLLRVIAGQCAAQGVNANQLSVNAGIPYASARRILSGRPMRVATTLQRILATLRICLLAIGSDGSCLPIPPVSADPVTGQKRRRAHLECLRRFRERHPEAGRDKHATGKLRIGKGDVYDLYRNNHLSYAEIGRIAGVSRHRVRQIVTMMHGA